MIYAILFLAIFSGIAIIIPAWSIIYNPYSTGKSKITRQGYFLLFAVIALIFLPIYLYNQQKNDEVKKDLQIKMEQDKRDSLLRRSYDSSLLVMKDKFDTTNFKTTAIIAENLGKYGYRFDSANGSLSRLIKDSSKTKIFVGDDPVLSIGEFDGSNPIAIKKILNKKITLAISLKSTDAGSSDFDLKYSFLLEDSSGYLLYAGDSYPINKNSIMAKNSIQVSFTEINTFLKPHFIYLWVRGKYKNIDKTKSFIIDEVYYHNNYGNTFGIMKGETRKKVIEKIELMEKK